MSNCQGTAPSSGWWIKGFGYFGHQDDRDNLEGYDSTIAGTMLAYDVPLGLDTRAGVGFGYARSTIDGNTNNASTDIDTYQGTAYVGHDQGPGSPMGARLSAGIIIPATGRLCSPA